MKKIKVTADVFIMIPRDIPTNELALRTEMALNSMPTLDIGEPHLFATKESVSLRFHFRGEPEVILEGE